MIWFLIFTQTRPNHWRHGWSSSHREKQRPMCSVETKCQLDILQLNNQENPQIYECNSGPNFREEPKFSRDFDLQNSSIMKHKSRKKTWSFWLEDMVFQIRLRLLDLPPLLRLWTSWLLLFLRLRERDFRLGFGFAIVRIRRQQV